MAKYNYSDAYSDYGNDFAGSYTKKSFRRLRKEQKKTGGVESYLGDLYANAPPANAPPDSGGPIPNTNYKDTFAFFKGGGKYNLKNASSAASDFFNNAMANQNIYRNSMNSIYNNTRNSAPAQAIGSQDLTDRLLSPVISDELLGQNINRSREMVTREQDAIQNALRAEIGGSGQRADAVAPAMAGAKYMAAGNAAQEENSLRNQAAIQNFQGLVQGNESVRANLASILGIDAQELQGIIGMMGSDERMWDTFITFLGSQQAGRER